MTMGERIRQLRKSMDLTQEELGKYVGIKKAAIAKYEKGNVQNMKRTTIEKLSHLFNVNPSYLMGLDDINNSNNSSKRTIKIPILGYIRAGVPIEAVEEILGEYSISEKTAKKGAFFALKVKGDSMFPYILENDVVVFKKQNSCQSGQVCAVIVNGDDATIKKIKLDETGIALIPFNPIFPQLHFTNEEIENKPVTIVGVYQELYRENFNT